MMLLGLEGERTSQLKMCLLLVISILNLHMF